MFLHTEKLQEKKEIIKQAAKVNLLTEIREAFLLDYLEEFPISKFLCVGLFLCMR